MITGQVQPERETADGSHCRARVAKAMARISMV